MEAGSGDQRHALNTVVVSLALLIGLTLYITYPSIPLLALALPPRTSHRTAIPSVTNLSRWSPTLHLQWLKLAFLTRTPPWRTHSLVKRAAEFDWVDNKPAEGDIVVTWERALLWRESDGCLPVEALRRWERMGDPIGDHLVSAGSDQPRSAEEVFRKLESARQPLDADPQLAPMACLLSGRAPRGSGPLPLSWYAKRDRRLGIPTPQWLQAESRRDFVDLIPHEELEDSDLALSRQCARYRDCGQDCLSTADLQEEVAEERRRLKLGQEVFYKYSGGILLALLHFSLAGGFASPRLSKVLRATNYLIPTKRTETSAPTAEKKAEQLRKDGDRTWRRLIETTQWVLDIMDSVTALDGCSGANEEQLASTAPTPPPAKGASSDVRTTFGGSGRRATLQVRFLHSRVRHRMQRMAADHGAVPLSQTDLLATLLSFSAAPLASLARMGLTLSEEEQDAYLGLWRYAGWLMGVDDRLIRRCLSSTSHADRALWSSVCNLFDDAQLRLEPPPTYSILSSIADRPPFNTSFALHCALTTSLVGQSLSDALALPRPSWMILLKVRITYLAMWFTTTFGRLYPRRKWEQERLRVTRTILRRLIQWNLGMKHSNFLGHAAGDAGLEDIAPDDGRVMRDIKVYQGLMREMVAVYALLALLMVAGLVILTLHHTDRISARSA
ncbi:unnamed protein product [Parajaminaea phylloscopi]